MLNKGSDFVLVSRGERLTKPGKEGISGGRMRVTWEKAWVKVARYRGVVYQRVPGISPSLESHYISNLLKLVRIPSFCDLSGYSSLTQSRITLYQW